MTSIAPPLFGAEFARTLTQSKSDVAAATEVTQLGASIIPFDRAAPWPDADPDPDPDDGDTGDAIGEVVIETFLVDVESGTLSPLGTDRTWIERWQPRAVDMVDRVLTVLAEHGVQLAGPGYLTCSITPSGSLEGLAHLDDAEFAPDAGIGIVAINGEHSAPRVALGPLSLQRPLSPGPIEFPKQTLDGVTRGELPDHRGPAKDITIFGQFGQLHAGPTDRDMPDHATHRQLMVLRVPTTPAS